MHSYSSIFVRGKLIIRELLRRAKGKSILRLIYIAISRAIARTVDSLILVIYRIKYPNVEFGSDLRIRGRLSIKGKGKVKIGNYCRFVNYNNLENQFITLDSSASIIIGDSCSFNGTTIFAMNSIEFKRQCMVSDAKIMDTDFHSVEINRLNPKVKSRTKPISIGSNVWVGSQSVILKGVCIGNNSVIGLGTIVRQSVPDNVVVIGNPQKIIKELDTTVLPYEFPH